jgi:hypothetical protein
MVNSWAVVVAELFGLLIFIGEKGDIDCALAKIRRGKEFEFSF